MKELSTVEFKLLVLLRELGTTGREIARDYERETHDKMPYGTLYTLLRRLKRARFISVQLDSKDGRTKVFKILHKGRLAMHQQAAIYRKLAGFDLSPLQ